MRVLKALAEVNGVPTPDLVGPVLPDIEDACDLLEAEVEDPPDVVTSILHRGAKMVIGGGSKSFKTWLLTDLGICVASGIDWLNFPTIRGRVLYINLEIQRGFFRSRLKAISAAKQMKLEAGTMDVWNLRGHAAAIELLIAQILERVGRDKYVLVIIDPIYKALGARDENKAGDIGSLLNEIERLAVESGAAVVFGAHFSKGNQAGKESIDRIGGSGVFARDPDTIFVLTRHEQDEAFTVETTLRNHAPVPPFVVRWDFPLMRRADDLDPAKLKQVVGRSKVHSTDDLLAQLGEKQLTYKQWMDAAKEHAGMSEGTFKKLRKELIDTKQVFHSKISQTYERGQKGQKGQMP